jgi:hypothetical protein
VQAEYNVRILFQQYGPFSARFLRCILESIAILYEQMGRANEAENMYLRALYGLEAVLGRPSTRCQDIIAALAALQGDRG